MVPNMRRPLMAKPGFQTTSERKSRAQPLRYSASAPRELPPHPPVQRNSQFHHGVRELQSKYGSAASHAPLGGDSTASLGKTQQILSNDAWTTTIPAGNGYDTGTSISDGYAADLQRVVLAERKEDGITTQARSKTRTIPASADDEDRENIKPF